MEGLRVVKRGGRMSGWERGGLGFFCERERGVLHF